MLGTSGPTGDPHRPYASPWGGTSTASGCFKVCKTNEAVRKHRSLCSHLLFGIVIRWETLIFLMRRNTIISKTACTEQAFKNGSFEDDQKVFDKSQNTSFQQQLYFVLDMRSENEVLFWDKQLNHFIAKKVEVTCSDLIKKVSFQLFSKQKTLLELCIRCNALLLMKLITFLMKIMLF